MKSEYITHPYSITILVFLILTAIGITLQSNERIEIKPRSIEKEVYIDIGEEVAASSAIIYDANSNSIIAGKNPEDLRSIASITKLISAVVFSEYLSGTDSTVIQSGDFNIDGHTPLRLGDKWQTQNLLEYSLITSSNRGINAVSRTVREKTGEEVVDLMNNFAQKNGLVQTHFVNSTGLDAHTSLSGSESSAIDLARLATIILRDSPELAEKTTKVSEVFYSIDGIKYNAQNTNKLLEGSVEDVLLSKTGFTGIAGGTLIMAFNKNESPIVFVVLESTKEGRFEDMETLLDLYESYQRIGVKNL